jgi:hypothetical protein
VIVQAYFLLFAGRQYYFSSVSLRIRVREQYAALDLAALILLGGLMPQAGALSPLHADDEILSRRLNSRPDLSKCRFANDVSRPLSWQDVKGHCPMHVLTSFVAACQVAEGLPGSMNRRMARGEVLGDRLRGLAGRKQAKSSHGHETICGAITR